MFQCFWLQSVMRRTEILAEIDLDQWQSKVSGLIRILNFDFGKKINIKGVFKFECA